jgi:hypothetical protein
MTVVCGVVSGGHMVAVLIVASKRGITDVRMGGLGGGDRCEP